MIGFSNDKGNQFLVQSVAISEGRWIIERNPNIHGTFTREATMVFDEFDPEMENYCFIENIAVPPLKIQQPSSDQ